MCTRTVDRIGISLAIGVAVLVVLIALTCIGCGGDARLEMVAADALEATADQMNVSLSEYHNEIASYDDSREASVTAAFIARIRRDVADEAKCDQHGSEFALAMAKIRADRRTEDVRAGNTAGQVASVREVARGLRRVGVESLTIQDEMRRYLLNMIDTQRKAKAIASQGTAGVRVPTATAKAFTLPTPAAADASTAGGSSIENGTEPRP